MGAVQHEQKVGCLLPEALRILPAAGMGKVRKILLTVGLIETEESKFLKQGLTVEEIARKLGKTVGAASGRIPYAKGMYNAEYPSENALKIRETRNKKGED